MTPEAIAQQAAVNAIEAQPQKKQRKLSPEEVDAMKAQQAKNEEEQRNWEQHEREMAKQREADEKDRFERRRTMTPEELASNNAMQAKIKAKQEREREAITAAMAMKKQMDWEMTQKVARNVGMSAQGVRNNKQEWSVPRAPGNIPTNASRWNATMAQEQSQKVAGNVKMKTPSENMAMGVSAGMGEGGKAPMPMTQNMAATAQNTTKKSSGNVGMGVPAVGQVPQGYKGQGVMSTQKEAKEATRKNSSDASTGAPPMDITPIVTALTTLNNTLIGSLAAIESRAKKNDINPALTSMNDFLSQINSSLPTPMGGGGPPKKGKSSKKKPKGKPVEIAKIPAQANIPPTIGGVITVLSQINTTLQTSLTAIESRLKKNDVNPAFETMNDYLSQINGSLPVQGGGGTRRSRVKKRNKTLRHRRT